MDAEDFFKTFLLNLAQAKWYEWVAVISGIVSVWFSKKENVLVYPVGLINTIIYVYISIEGHLLGEASVNFYYTVMSVIGWYHWAKKDKSNIPLLHITSSSAKEWFVQIGFFALLYLIIFLLLVYFKKAFFAGVIPWADALASASAFTGMWLMTRKKTESWYWWILTNLVSIPLYFVKEYALTSIYYLVLLVLAFAGLAAWKRKQNATMA